MTITALSSRRHRKLRRPSSLGEVGSPSSTSLKSLASAPSPKIRTSRKPSLSPPPATSTGHTYGREDHHYSSDFEETRSLSLSRGWPRGRSTSPKLHIFGDRPLPTAYASLPPTPLLCSRPFTPPASISPISQTYANVQPQEPHPGPPFSLWDYLREELLATDFDSHQELKWERVSNFLSMPLAMEKVCISVHISIFK